MKRPAPDPAAAPRRPPLAPAGPAGAAAGRAAVAGARPGPGAASAPATDASATAAAPPTAGPTAAAAAGAAAAGGSWRSFADTDPLYALLGEVRENHVFGEDGNLKKETLARYLDRGMAQQAAKKPKDWVELWAAMEIPVDSQALVLEPLLRFGLEHAPKGLGEILTALLKGHRVKTKAIEVAIQGTFQGMDDKLGILQAFLFNILPKGPNSEWGWSRTGWSWQEWWKMLESTLSALAPEAAFDALGALLDRIEATGGSSLAQQAQIWNERRLATTRALLCKYGGVQNEADLLACIDAGLT